MANYGLGLVSPVADGGVAHYLDIVNTFASGKLLSLRNNTSEKFFVDFEGSITGHDANLSGAVAISGALAVTGNVAINTNKFTVTAASGNTLVAGTLNVTGAAALASTLAVTGDVAVNTNKFTVTAASGNTLVAGTFTSTGAATLSSTLALAGNLAINTNKFTVTAASGNTLVAGTFTSTGAGAFSSTLAITGDTSILSGSGLVVGHTTLLSIADATPELQVLGTSTDDSIVGIGRWSADAASAAIRFYKSRHATIGSIATVVTGDKLGSIRAYGDDGTDPDTQSSAIIFGCEGTIAAGQVPGVIIFQTAAAGPLVDVLTLNSSKLATFTGVVSVTDATDATSATAASLKTAGGIAAVKALWIGTTSRLVGAVTVNSTLTVGSTSALTGNVGIGQAAAAQALRVTEADADQVLHLRNTHNATPFGAYIDFTAAAPNDRTQYFLQCDDSGATRITLWSDGSIQGDGELLMSGTGASSFAGTLAVTGNVTLTAGLLAAGDDQGAIGASGTAFSDLFLASGAVIDFSAGDVTLTHSAAKMTWGGDGAVEIDFNNHEMTNVDIDSGTIDNVAIGGAIPAAIAGTTGAFSGTLACVGDFAVNTNKFTVTAASGNTLVAGTLTVTGAFGCNGQAAQTAYASGGALAAYGTGAFGLDSDANMSALHALIVAIRAALVADGIMS